MKAKYTNTVPGRLEGRIESLLLWVDRVTEVVHLIVRHLTQQTVIHYVFRTRMFVDKEDLKC